MIEQRAGALQPSPAVQRAAKAPAHHPTPPMIREPGDEDDYEREPVSGEFAGIAMSEFVWARQHARRMVVIWVAVVVALTGLVATAAWTIGSHLSGLL